MKIFILIIILFIIILLCKALYELVYEPLSSKYNERVLVKKHAEEILQSQDIRKIQEFINNNHQLLDSKTFDLLMMEIWRLIIIKKKL
jgi:mevalonate kinase